MEWLLLCIFCVLCHIGAAEVGAGYFPGLYELSKTVGGYIVAGGTTAKAALDRLGQAGSGVCDAMEQ